MKYKTTIILLLVVGMGLLLSAFMPQQPEPQQQPEFKAKNLKVLPKNITKDEIDEVMDEFKVALGVKCGFCHASQANDPKKLDFASDEKPEKLMARKMMKMTAKINKKYFHELGMDGAMLAISCNTCHNGKEKPETLSLL
jgi:formate dehydrogenase assembly factor FdhD